MKFVNLTPHKIVLNDGTSFESEGVARVSSKYTDFNEDKICEMVFEDEITGLPEPEKDTIYIVSSIVLPVAKQKGRNDVVAPATGHPDCCRENGFVKSVPGFVR